MTRWRLHWNRLLVSVVFVPVALFGWIPAGYPQEQLAIRLGKSSGPSSVTGEVVVKGLNAADTAGQYVLEINVVNTDSGGDAVICASSSMSAGEVADGALGFREDCSANKLERANPLSELVALGDDLELVLFTFQIELSGSEGDTFAFSFTETSDNSLLGLNLNGGRTIGGTDDTAVEPVGAQYQIISASPPTPTPTPNPQLLCADAGYYILDSLGGRHRVGIPPNITGSLYFGRAVAEDMERILSPDEDLAVVDTFGAVHFVANPGANPGQGFYFPEGATATCGFAVDVEVTEDNAGFWVLTEGGGIYRAGSALPGGADGSQPLGNDAGNLCSMLPLSFGGSVPRDPQLPDPDPTANIRAVGFVVVKSGDPANPAGFVVLDSQGGHYLFDGSGNTLDDDVAGSVLNGPGGGSETVYPFFPGLDIARDIELEPGGTATSGLVILDGWGGIHPVPVDAGSGAPVEFLRNEGAGWPATTVGLPYIITGFDDPTTAADEGDPTVAGIDSNSIFRDIEFCQTVRERIVPGAVKGIDEGLQVGPGVYVLDAFGGVFAFGSTRPDDTEPVPAFSDGPYFYPFLYAEDLEAFDNAETDFGQGFEIVR